MLFKFPFASLLSSLGVFGRTDSRDDQAKGDKDQDAADDPRHDGEIEIVHIGFIPRRRDEGSLGGAGLLGINIREHARSQDRSANEKQGPFEGNSVQFADGARLLAFAIPEEGQKGKQARNGRDEGDGQEFRHDITSRFFRTGEDEGQDPREGRAKVGTNGNAGDKTHLRVLVHVIAVHFDEGDVDADDDDDGKDEEEGNRKGKFAVAKVRGGQTIEPSAVEEEEQSDEEAETDVARDGIANGAIVIAMDDAFERKSKTEETHKGPGQAKSAKLPRKGDAQIGQIDGAIAADDERRNQNTSPNAERNKSREQNQE